MGPTLPPPVDRYTGIPKARRLFPPPPHPRCKQMQRSKIKYKAKCTVLFFFSEVELPEKTAEVGSGTSPMVPPPTSDVTDKVLQRASMAGGNVGLFIPPDMSKVFYKESYEEFVRLKEPMEPRSFCWTPKQELYVGCAGGQLMMVDFDSGDASVLVNPHPTAEVR